MPRQSPDRWLGLFMICLALAIVFVWVPLDTETGLVERVRRRNAIGDAMGPTVAGVILGMGGLLTFLAAGDPGKSLSRDNVLWLGKLALLFVTALLVMRWLGPLIGSLTESGYRPLRGTIPWKYLGFVVGGAIMVTGLTALATRRLNSGYALLGLIAATAIALLYDLPFEDLLLPPNGDV